MNLQSLNSILVRHLYNFARDYPIIGEVTQKEIFERVKKHTIEKLDRNILYPIARSAVFGVKEVIFSKLKEYEFRKY